MRSSRCQFNGLIDSFEKPVSEWRTKIKSSKLEGASFTGLLLFHLLSGWFFLCWVNFIECNNKKTKKKFSKIKILENKETEFFITIFFILLSAFQICSTNCFCGEKINVKILSLHLSFFDFTAFLLRIFLFLLSHYAKKTDDDVIYYWKLLPAQFHPALSIFYFFFAGKYFSFFSLQSSSCKCRSWNVTKAQTIRLHLNVASHFFFLFNVFFFSAEIFFS